MLSSLFGKKTDHPLADIKSAQVLLGDLPKSDALKSLAELADWIELLLQQEEFRADHQFAVLRLLDEAAQPHARKLAHDYFSPGELSKFQENRLWGTLDNYYLQTANAYGRLFDRSSNGEKGSSALREHLPLIAARSLHALTRRLKYASAHYSPADGSIWADIAKLYRHAERQNYLDIPVETYSGVAGSLSVRHAAGHLLGWYGCGVGALSPLDIHFAERIVAQHCAAIKVSEQPDEGSLFGFDLEQPSAPMRLKVNNTPHASMRYVDMTAMLPKLQDMLRTLDKNVVPDGMNLGGAYEAEMVRGAVRYLLDYLTESPLRRSARRTVKVDMNVVSGFASMIERVGAGNGEERQVYWEVEDISNGGFRAVLPVQGVDGIRIGTLLGVRPAGVPHWGAAAVRRLMRDGTSLLHVGAEMLSSQIEGVILGSSGDAQPALWLQAKPGEPADEVRLLMKADTFSMHRSLHAAMNGTHYLLMPLGLAESGPDYDLARFRFVEKEPGEDGAY